mgnify:CR=1 FL=1
MKIGTALEDLNLAEYEALTSSLVERTLESPRYGEHWGRYWLDVAGYADSNGYQGDGERTMWPWRDWVISAFNRNMRINQFIVWQIAGDLPERGTEIELDEADLDVVRAAATVSADSWWLFLSEREELAHAGASC